MAIQLQVRRGTTAQNDAFTGAVGELSVNTDTSAIRVHDGATAGGVELARSSQIDSLLVKSVAGAVDVTLSAGEAGNSNHEYTGILTGNINVIVPAASHNFTAENLTTGAYTLTVKTAAGAGVLIPQGKALQLYCNGTDVEDSNSAKANDSEVAKLAGATFTGPVNAPSYNGGGLLGRNRIINGNFSINQRVVTGTVVLGAGVYGHDRWKAGAGGCTYTFATSENVTTITISAGTLMQVIEGLNLQSGAHVLSWTGTAQGRVDAGSYGASGVAGTAVGGTNQTIEFGTGTVALVQYEGGTVATPFEHRQYGDELRLCQRYTCELAHKITNAEIGVAYASTTTLALGTVTLPETMRAAPTVTITNPTTLVGANTVGNYVACTSASGDLTSPTRIRLTVGFPATTFNANQATTFRESGTTLSILASAEL